MMRRRMLLPALAFVGVAIAAGCGAKSTGSMAPPTSAPMATPSPHVGPTAVPLPSASPQVISLAGGGYTLTFTVPPIVTGTTATMSAVLQTSLPNGTNAPQAHRVKPAVVRPLASTFNGLAYLVVSTTANVGFASAPSFSFTVPAGTIAAGQNAYLLFWDPATGSINGWVNLLGPGTVSGTTVSFPGVATGVQLAANTQYVYALAVTTQSVPTATPAPTPSPTPIATATASPAALPVYCSTEGVSASNGLTLNITDSSGLNSALVIYVQQQAQGTTGTEWMNASGVFVTTPVPLPAVCYSSTEGSGATNNPLVIPSGHAGRIYLAYASPVPASATSAPNPFAGIGAGQQPVNGVATGQAPFPYDKVEYNSTAGVIDTTQVDFMGLPLEMQAVENSMATPLPQAAASPCSAPVPTAAPFAGLPQPGTVVGVGQCGYAAIYQSLLNDANYKNLVSVLPWGNQTIDFRAISPSGSYSYTPFNYNLLGDSSVAVPSACTSLVGGSTATNGYLTCVLAQYKLHPQVFQALSSLGGNGDNDQFCISSDGSSNFIATDIGTATTCGSPAKATGGTLPTNPFKMPIALFTNAYYQSSGASGGCFYGELFNGPYGNANVGSGQVFTTADAFTLWKALTLEINYGTMFVNAPHPVESTPPSFQGTPGLFQDPASNAYAKIVHSYFDGNYAYAISYDDGFSWFSGYSISAPGAINIRVNPVPTNAPATSANPVPFPNPTCSTFTLGVGSY